MVQFDLPEAGLTLTQPLMSNTHSIPEGKNPQIMQLDLEASLLRDVLRSARQGGKGVNVTFGKKIALHCGNKSHFFTAAPSHFQSHLYDSPQGNDTHLTSAGRLSHKLLMQKAHDSMAGTDAALAKLQSQMASHKEAKQSMQIKYISDSSKLPPPVKQTAASLKQRTSKAGASSLVKKTKSALLRSDTIRSMPTSPSLSATRTPLTPDPHLSSTPVLPDGKTQRLQALRSPLIHFLAARPASTKLLSQHLKGKEDEILGVLEKVAKRSRLDESKWDLIDRAYKELDIWNFHYPNEDDRGLAINRARSAFDRMRISTQDPIWDTLLPKHERGKGKILSHLNLHKGPIQRASTPKIKIQHSATGSTEDLHAASDQHDSKDRLTPGAAAPMARSKSHGPIKRTKISEKEAKSKHLLNNGPKKSKPESKVKEAHPATKKGGAKKSNAPKSSEFVNDSDEDDGLEDQVADLEPRKEKSEDNVPPGISKPSASPNPTPSGKAAKGAEGKTDKVMKPKPAPAVKMKKSEAERKLEASTHEVSHIKKQPATPATPNGIDAKGVKNNAARVTKGLEKIHPSSGTSSPAQKSRQSDSSQNSVTMQKSLSRQRNTSSPHKPSPLGSSPPTNASDLETTVRSSSSSTPLKEQARKVNGTTNGEGAASVNHATNTSEQSLKRKAGDVDSDTHNHSASCPSDGVNGTSQVDHSVTKRRKTSEVESPSSSSSDSPSVRDTALKKAQMFKIYYANYQKKYLEISQMEDAPNEKIEDLMKLHHRLAEMKEQIMNGLIEA